MINIYSHFADSIMSDTKQLLAQIPNTVDSTVRTSYIICDAQWQREIAGPFVEKSLRISRWQQESTKQKAQDPSEFMQTGTWKDNPLH